MNSTIFLKTYKSIPINKKEILRYAGCKEATEEVSLLLDDCITEAEHLLSYRVCYREFHVATESVTCSFDDFTLKSESLALNLKGCKRGIIFGATIGIEMDRLIAKYGRLSPAKALIFQALGAERIEALCDAFCDDIESEYNTKAKPRFSPGYGDLPLECQKYLFDFLNCERKIGLTLNQSFLRIPSKSVTAFVGFTD